MKKLFSSILMLLLIFNLSACSKNNNKNFTHSKASQEKNNIINSKNNTNVKNEQKEENLNISKTDDKKNDLTLKDYYPSNPNISKTFKGGFENAGEEYIIDLIKEDKIQWRVHSTGTSVAQIVQITDEQIVLLATQEGVYEFEDLTDMEPNRNEVLLKTPLEIGTTWAIPFDRTRSITGLNIKVSTPAGEYEALEVTTTLPDGSENKTYYAPGVGLIKDVSIYDGTEMGITLEKITETRQ